MINLGLIGYPLGHSLSPRIHAAALRSCELEGSYSLFPIHPDDNRGLKDLLGRVRNGELAGLNVTIPHKQKVIELLDALTPAAKAIGAVNIIYLENTRLIGGNTDAPGFLSDLKSFLTTETLKHRNRSALVLGAGGSARAIVFALLNDGWEITAAARRTEQAQQLADSFANYQLPRTVCSFSNLRSLDSYPSLIVNTTPVGMTPDVEQSPWPENLSLPPHATVYDLVYNPAETKLVREAHRQGLRAKTGLGMLIEQAALAFETWTGKTPSREALFDALNQTVH